MLRPKLPVPASSQKLVALVKFVFQLVLSVVILAVIYRYCWIDNSDPYKCGALLNKGSWLDPPRFWHTQNAFQHWQPPGCLMHRYEKKDIQDCFRTRRLVFIGDSTIRQIYRAVTKKMGEKKAHDDTVEMLDINAKHTDLEFTSGGVVVKFIWDPWLNSTGLHSELKAFKADAAPSGMDSSAGLILAGAPGLWYAKHGEENYFKDFRNSVEDIIPYMDHSPKAKSSTRPKIFFTREELPNFLLLAPVQVPRYQLLSPPRVKDITPTKIDQMNDFLQQISAHSKADVVWSYSAMTRNGRAEYDDTGIHVVENVAAQKADILLNLRCNVDSANKKYPFDKTCCSNYTKPGAVQWTMLLVALFGLPTLMSLQRKYVLLNRRAIPPPEVTRALVIIALVICTCFYADRTQVFEKAHKQVQTSAFLWSIFSIFVIAVFSIRKNTQAEMSPSKVINSVFLSRDQTDEWKGWMLGIILVYHYTHSSKTLWIYEVVHLLVAAYLFMTGYGHTLFFLRKNDYSLKRAAAVLLRLNLLCCILPYMMRTTYHFYYFAPLVSFWFGIIYFTMKIGQNYNTNLRVFVAKLLLSAVCTTVFVRLPGLMETISSLLWYTCAISLNVKEWRFRISLDMYVVYVGMLLAALYNRSLRPKAGNEKAVALLRWTSSPTFKVISILAALYTIPFFWAVSKRWTTKEEYNSWHPYLSCLPVAAYITLRNCHPVLRDYHSAGMAWLGRFSLETYVLHYHIWLAGDTKGLLRTGVFSERVDTVLLGLTLLWLAWCMSSATEIVTEWIVQGPKMGLGSADRGGRDAPTKEKGSPYVLPRSRTRSGGTDDGTPSKDLRFEFGGGGIVGKLARSLKLRLLLIAFSLWVGNILYP